MKKLTSTFSLLLIIVMAFSFLPSSIALADPILPDTLGPITSAVVVTPNPVLLNGKATVTALVDDTPTGGSNILSAEYSLDGGAFLPMKAVDGAFDAVSEAVTATFTVTTVGQHTVCVRGTDVVPNVGAPVCVNFSVQFVFKGFKPPVKMGQINKAKGGQAIPLKWQLTDANKKPISAPASFVAVKSYLVDCTTLVGDPTTATVEGAPGHSGLKYQGNGNWQFNWKTLKSYSGTCRKMFVAFNGGQTSPEVVFRFK
jgi:hypothetical protein